MASQSFFTRVVVSSFYHSSYYFIRWCGFALVVLDAFDSIFKSIGWIFHAHWCPFTWSPRSDVLSVNTNSKGKSMICFTRFGAVFQPNQLLARYFVVDRVFTEERIWTGQFAVAMDYLEYGGNVFVFLMEQKDNCSNSFELAIAVAHT